MGGETAFGGKEVVVIMGRTAGRSQAYKLLAANKTSTLEKEMQDAADTGTSTRDKQFSNPRSVAVKSA